MSDLQIPSLNFGGNNNVPDTSNSTVPTTDQNEDGLLNPFLSNIPEQDRQIVAKYAKDWDSNVTKKFQSIHEQYTPYKELGDIDSIQRAVELVSILEEDPKRFYENLAEIIASLDEEGSMDPDLFDDDEQINQNTQDLDPRDAEIADLKQAIENLSNKFSESEQAAIDAEQMQELDDYLQELHNEHGDFDEDWVLVQMSRGTDPVEAIKAWNKKLEDGINSRRKAAPPSLIPGAGGIPGSQVDPSKFNPSDRKAYVAAMLDAANNQ